MRVTSHVPAHETRNLSSSAGVQWTQIARLHLVGDSVIREWQRCTFAAAHVVRVTVGKDDDIPWLEPDLLSAQHLNNRSAFNEQMVQNDVTRAGGEPGC